MIVSGKFLFAFNSRVVTSNLICLTILVRLRSLTQFKPEIKGSNSQKTAEICLTW